MIIMEEVKVPWTININNVDEKKLIQNVSFNMKTEQYTRFFNSDSINLFTDGSVVDKSTIGCIAHCIVINNRLYGTSAHMSNISFMEGTGSSTMAELASILYGLIGFNDSRLTSPILNVFTDSLNAVSMIRVPLLEVERSMSEGIPFNKIHYAIDKDRRLSDLGKMICHERLSMNVDSLRIYHVKGHCRDLLQQVTTFERLNGEPITLYDASLIVAYNSFVDRYINASLRAGEKYYSDKY